jgi:bacteriophage N4 adsorption protein B
LQAAQWGFKSRFLCHHLCPDERQHVEKDKHPARKIIATKEFFPHLLKASIRQKTRWTAGIAFQGFKNMGWFGNLTQRYRVNPLFLGHFLSKSPA